MAAGSVEDRMAIGDLFVRYANALDSGDVATVVECFTADAALESPVIGAIAGHEAIRAFAERFAGQRANGVQFRHMVTNIAADIDAGGGHARATAYLLVLITRNGKSRMLPPGRYECDLVNPGGGWRFRRRVVIHDHEYTLEEL